jgi:hypothetical protein
MINTLTKILNNMIINKQTNEVLKTGEDTSKKATISANKAAKLQMLLSEGLYSDPITAVIAELTNNGVDSIVASGKNPIENPVLVSITRSINDQYEFSVKDVGLGLDEEEFTNIVMNYLESTKEDSNDFIGSWGLGSKSPLSLKRSYFFICRKEGIERKFMVYQGEEFTEFDKIYEKPTDEINGVEVIVPIKDYYEAQEFVSKAKSKLAYYDTVILQIYGQIIQNTIYRSDDWQFSTQNIDNQLHFCLKDVYYSIDWVKLGISTINLPIALKFDLSDGLIPSPSREYIIYNQASKEIILNKIKKVANWFIDKYNSEWKEYETFKDAWEYINQYYFYVNIENNEFKINDLEDYANNKIKTTKVKNIEDINWYYDNRRFLLSNYIVLAENTNRNLWVNKNLSDGILEKIMFNYNIVVVNSEPKHRIKSYLKDKYPNTIFIKKICDRTLGQNDKQNKTTYFYTLALDRVPQHEWKHKIKELNYVENQLKQNFIYELDIENSEEFQNWLKEKKEERVQYSSDSNHKVLNKQEDEVTIAFGRQRSIGKGVTFEKETYKINSLNQKPYLTIYFEEKEKATQYYELIGKKYKIALIGKREQSKIKNIHNFMTEQEFQKSKVFKRIVTSVMFDELIETYRSIYSRSSLDIIQNLINPLEKDIEILQDYTSKNGKSIRDNQLLDSMIAIAKEYNLYDYQFMDVYNRCKESLDKYKFLNYIQKPDRWNEENVKEVNSIITQFLYHQKMYRGLHQELEFVIKETEFIEEQKLEIV